MEFLLALGWPVDVDSHPGWTGNIEKAWKQPRETVRKPLLPGQVESVKYSSLSTITGSSSTITGSDGVDSGPESELSAREKLLRYRESFGSEEILSGRGSRSDSPMLAGKKVGSPKTGRKFEKAYSTVGESNNGMMKYCVTFAAFPHASFNYKLFIQLQNYDIPDCKCIIRMC